MNPTPHRPSLWRIALALFLLAAAVAALTGCASGKGPATNGSGNIVMNGDVYLTNIKQFAGAAPCYSLTGTTGQGAGETGGGIKGSALEQGGEAAASTAANYIRGLTSADGCVELEGTSKFPDPADPPEEIEDPATANPNALPAPDDEPT